MKITKPVRGRAIGWARLNRNSIDNSVWYPLIYEDSGACLIDGPEYMPLAVHRRIRTDNDALCPARDWTVTELRTGASVLFHWLKPTSRREAVAMADNCIVKTFGRHGEERERILSKAEELRRAYGCPPPLEAQS